MTLYQLIARIKANPLTIKKYIQILLLFFITILISSHYGALTRQLIKNPPADTIAITQFIS
jgi:hypothetical protein